VANAAIIASGDGRAIGGLPHWMTGPLCYLPLKPKQAEGQQGHSAARKSFESCPSGSKRRNFLQCFANGRSTPDCGPK
jgi:hypothetical protein